MRRPDHGPIAIIGAGWLGRALAEALPGPVVATTRSGTWGSTPPAHVTVRPLDITQAPLDVGPIAAATAVVIAVAPGTGRREGAHDDQARHALYVEGTARLLATVSPACRVVFVGSTSALPDVDGWLDETCATWPDHARGRTQRQAERVVLAHHDGNLVLRMGGLFGPERELHRIYRTRDPAVPRPGDGMTPTNLVHRDDAVAAVLAALTRPHVRGIVHVVADGHTPRRTMYARSAARCGTPPPIWSEAATSAHPRGKRVSNLRLKLELGVRLAHPWPA